MHGERDVDADVAGGLRHCTGLGREIRQALNARVMRHGGAHAAACDAPERHRRSEPGVDRGDEREIGQPGFQRHVEAADLAQPRHPRMVVRTGKGGQHEAAVAGTLFDGGNAAVGNRNGAVRDCRIGGIRNEPRRRNAMIRHSRSPAITRPLTC